MKYDLKFKLKCVRRMLKGKDIPASWVTTDIRSFTITAKQWLTAYKARGIKGLKRKPFNTFRTAEEKFALVAKVLAGSAISKVAAENGVTQTQLSRWARDYTEKGMEGLESSKPGRKKAMPNKETPKGKKKPKPKLTPSEKEELRILRERNEFPEMENAYLKK